jgi:glycosyltransferase involved in cell wall biosynthesis
MAWRDFDDAEAGGSELHAHRILSEWAKAGVNVVMTTSAVAGAPRVVTRDGYRVTRRLGRYQIFPRTILSGVLGHLGQADGVVEIWNGMPFFSPLWARCPRVVFLHHVHGEMWRMALPAGLAEFGHAIEHHVAPPFYRSTQIVTLSESSKQEIVERLRLPAANITVSPPGVEPHFSPGTTRSEHPLVVAVGRLVPVKQFELVIDAALELRQRHPDLEVVIAGEGYERTVLEERVRAAGAQDWLRLPGFVSDEELVELYRSAWVVTSASAREGWGMTVTEAGACGTPAVVSRIGGHLDAVVDGESGYLFDSPRGMVDGLDRVLTDEVLRKRLADGAQLYASGFSWYEAARLNLAVLAADALRRRGGRRS